MTVALPAAALASCDASALVSICEQAEQESAALKRDHPYPREHLLSLLLLNDLEEARFLWLRLGEGAREKSKDVWDVAKSLRSGNRREFYTFIDVLTEQNHRHQVIEVERVQPMVNEILRKNRLRTIRLINEAYNVLSISKAIEMLGLNSVDELRSDEYCERYGWKIEEDMQFMRMGGNESVDEIELSLYDSSKESKYTQLELLTQQLVKLQTQI